MTTPIPELPTPSGYGIKSIYGFDPQDGHKRLIGLSIDKPGTWADSRTVQLFTADQMQAYARAAIEATEQGKPGYQLVPIEPTIEMIDAAITNSNYWPKGTTDFESCYRAMITATPQGNP